MTCIEVEAYLSDDLLQQEDVNFLQGRVPVEVPSELKDLIAIESPPDSR